MSNAYSNFTKNSDVPQTEALPGQTQNNAGGFSFQVDQWTQLERFLVLGSSGGTYYVSEQKLTRESAACVDACLSSDPQRTINMIVAVSVEGKAARVQPAIFALALASVHPSLEARQGAYKAVSDVCRTGTHLFTYISYVTSLKDGRAGSGFMRAIRRWYTDKPVSQVAYQTVKYRNREGWTHSDALRIAHPTTEEKDRKHLFDFVSGRPNEKKIAKHESLKIVEGFLTAQSTTKEKDIVHLISEYNLPWETLPTEFHNSKAVWEAIFDAGQLGLTALIRQLPRLTNLGVINTRPIATQLKNAETLRRARVHPLLILNALYTYKSGGAASKGNTTWNAHRKIIDALDEAFYLAFENVEPTGKRINIGLDVSGSMGWPNIANTNLSPREASAALCLVTAATESDYEICGFSSDYVHLDISPRQRLDDVLKVTSGLPFAGTDCSLPMRWALANKYEFDAFVVLTDSETWAGRVHPTQALQKYRDKMGIDAKLVVVGMVSSEFSIADPTDAGMVDVVGFSTDTPKIISDFIRG